jgi:hypothetical protein
MQDADGPAPAVDPFKLRPDIIHDFLSESEAARLWLDPVFMSAQFRAHQIVRLLEFASTKLPIAL